MNSFRELVLQFKSPRFSEPKNRFTISLTRHQHILLKEYPQFSAYYVTHTFTSIVELFDQQRAVKTSADFLKYFVCIEVSSLPLDVDFIQYTKPESHRESPNLRFKQTCDGSTRTAAHKIEGKGWERGNTLIDKLKNDAVGTIVELAGRTESTTLSRVQKNTEAPECRLSDGSNVWVPRHSEILQQCSNCKASEIPILLRKPAPA